MEEELDIKLKAYAKSDYYPFHMPGHKRRSIGLTDAYGIDITEIDGFDNLHAAEDILQKAQMRAAKLYDSKKTYYLINGSSCGILAAISAAVGRGKKLLMARNVHKAVSHAVFLMQLSTVYLQPEMTEFGIQGEITPQIVKEALEKNPDASAVMITSPTYEGIVSDVETIAKIVHEYKIPLIVDEAHGAHFGFHPAFPETAVRQGADIVIQSMHKVLPSLTQTALLHLNSEFIAAEKIEKFLNIYETSSPSYVLMAGMEACVRLLREQAKELFFTFYENLTAFYIQAKELSHIQIMPIQENKDPSKLVISVKNTNMTGKELYDVLLHKYHLQMEMVSGYYVLAMTSIMDTKEGFLRLSQALKEIDATLSMKAETDTTHFVKQLYSKKRKVLEVYQAEELSKKEVSFDEAIGKVSAASVYIYPPGIPVLLPGEIIDEDFIKNVRKSVELRLNLQGIADIINERINIVNF
ncbi:MAG: aminotransferase class V-fold PLP-dependent enzyme [Lachnospiraceae bacterium]|nr:aminotransferase class V-fold PLP-dependent enzyme [Lachnospiraceae bacterium]